MIMVKFKSKKKKRNLTVAIIMSVFALIGLTFLLIGFGSEALVWMRTFGITILVIVSPILVIIIFKEISDKVKGM